MMERYLFSPHFFVLFECIPMLIKGLWKIVQNHCGRGIVEFIILPAGSLQVGNEVVEFLWTYIFITCAVKKK